MVNDDYRGEITTFVQSIPGFQECNEDVETWMTCDAEDCGFQMLMTKSGSHGVIRTTIRVLSYLTTASQENRRLCSEKSKGVQWYNEKSVIIFHNKGLCASPNHRKVPGGRTVATAAFITCIAIETNLPSPQLEWCRPGRDKNATKLNQVIFTEKFRFILSSDDNRVRVWRLVVSVPILSSLHSCTPLPQLM
ncbi:uncharacterized protein TNCV_897371 [Trichonephila clavipes]|nr:uncharacterized protein TNCV_897371 [Trichonephila clavipes]